MPSKFTNNKRVFMKNIRKYILQETINFKNNQYKFHNYTKQNIQEYIINYFDNQNLQEGPIGAAISHVASNILSKKLVHSKKGRRIATAIFRKGVKDTKKGKRIISPIRGAVNALMGPEAGSIYDLGKKSTRASRLTANVIKKITPSKSTTHKLADIVTGKEAKTAKKILKKVPTTSKKAGKLSKAAEWGTGVATAAVTSPTVGGWNLARTALAKTKAGPSILKKAAKKSYEKGKTLKGLKRKLSDYVGSPSLSVATDVGKEAKKVTKDIAVSPEKYKRLLQRKGVKKSIKNLIKSTAGDKSTKLKAYKKLRKAGVSKEMITKGYSTALKKSIKPVKKLKVIQKSKNLKAA